MSNPRPWVGLRPATPTSVPIVRRSKADNVFLNLGHGALGFALAAGSAILVSSLVRSGRDSGWDSNENSLTPDIGGAGPYSHTRELK